MDRQDDERGEESFYMVHTVGIVLLGHGSRGDSANDGMMEVARSLRGRPGYPIVEVGFMQRNFPTIEEAAEACVARGADTIFLIPYFLHFGLHMQKDLPQTVKLLRELHPGVRFTLGKPFAHHPALLDIVLDRIEECREAGCDLEVAGDGDEEEPHPRPNRRLRTGFTTGACAAAAAKAAAQVLLSQRRVIETEITLPDGQRVTFPVGRCEIGPHEARCSVIKRAGDDPDVTDGAEICVSVGWHGDHGIAIEGGKGVGVVTKPGLEVPVGEAAINPVPRRMIAEAVSEALGDHLQLRGVRVVVSVPAGEALARRTLNARLGIVGGISILGTTGVEIPYSAAAFTASISQAMKVARATGCSHIVLTTGRRSERFAQGLIDLPEEAFIQAGDHIDFALEECVRIGFPRVTLCLLVGKLSKIAAGHLQTHAGTSTVDAAFLASEAEAEGADPTTVEEIRASNSSRHFAEILLRNGPTSVFDRLCRRGAENCRTHTGGRLAVECILTDFDGKVLGRSGVVG